MYLIFAVVCWLYKTAPLIRLSQFRSTMDAASLFGTVPWTRKDDVTVHAVVRFKHIVMLCSSPYRHFIGIIFKYYSV